VLYGEAEHPEVRGILSWTRGRGVATQSTEVEVPEGAAGIAVIAQTTKNPGRFAGFAEGLVKRYAGRVPEIRVVDTTCPETGRRYEAARALASTVDVLLVVGSRTSANTRKLVETCRETGVSTHHIESANEIDDAWFVGHECVGVTAGASTPDAVIDEVVGVVGRAGDERRSEARARGEERL
jgi:(E)-4-hydroxy-3-methyl-but-2-enyl pyrophosphate reductase